MTIPEPYLLQTYGSHSILIAILNARIFYQKPIKDCQEGDEQFKRLSKEGGCEKGECFFKGFLFKSCEIHAESIGLDKNEILESLASGFCIMLTLSKGHSFLVVSHKDEIFETVNSKIYSDCTIEWHPWESLSNCKMAYELTPIEKL